MSRHGEVSRRDVLRSVASAVLVLGLTGTQLESWSGRAISRTGGAAPFRPNPFLAINEDGTVTVWNPRPEIGQGIFTSLALIVADELGASWDSVRVVQAEADARFGDMRVGGSGSIRKSFEPFRRAAAAAREMLVTAAATRWGVGRENVRCERGMVLEVGGTRQASFADLAAVAAGLAVPEAPRLKARSELTLLGTRVPRLDTPDKVAGRARFGIDVRLPGMVYAALVRPPALGGTLRGFEAGAARRLSGVLDVIRAGPSVAVIADSSWAALRGAAAVAADFELAAGAGISSEAMWTRIRGGLTGKAGVAASLGDAVDAVTRAERRHEAIYEVPFLPHATMEPQNCTAVVSGNQCRIWAPTQDPIGAREAAAAALDLTIEQVAVQPTFSGCGLGRRSESDFVEEAALVAKAVGKPVQVIWSRSDDFSHDRYHPATATRMQAVLGPSGKPTAWIHRVAGPSLARRWGPLENDVDHEMVWEMSPPLYAIANHRVEFVETPLPVPLGYVRSVARIHNTFAIESFVDELAHAAGADPYTYRRELLADERARNVLDVAVERAGWNDPPGAGAARGLAVLNEGGTRLAVVAEVALIEGRARVRSVVAAVDCGLVIQPNVAQAQIEGGLIFGLTIALGGEITFAEGRPRETTFAAYPLIRFNEAPRIDVHLVPTDAPPTGIGEVGVSGAAPAVANALFRLTGSRARRLPLTRALAQVSPPR